MFEVLFQKLKSLPTEYCYNSTLLSESALPKFTTEVPLVHFGLKEKQDLLTSNYFVVQRRIWRNQFDEERAKVVPVIICRVCT